MKKPKDDVVGMIYQTKNILQFNFFNANRSVNKNTVQYKEIKKSAQKLHEILVPIEVNEDYQIVDGQHRALVAYELGLPIKYWIRHRADENDIISINSTGKRWNTENFIEFYAKAGNLNYLKLNEQLKEYKGLSTTIIASVDQKATLAGPITSNVKNGEFNFQLNNDTEYFLQTMNDFALKHRRFLTGSIITAIFRLFWYKNFDLTRMLNKLEKMKKYELPAGDGLNTTKSLIDIYNGRLSFNSKKRISYVISDKGLRIENDKKDWK